MRDFGRESLMNKEREIVYLFRNDQQRVSKFLSKDCLMEGILQGEKPERGKKEGKVHNNCIRSQMS